MQNDEFAKQVATNMVDDSIRYKYIFEYKTETVETMTLVVKKIIDEAKTICGRDLEGAVTEIGKCLSVYFVRENPGVDYCVHNSQTNDARCYLRCVEPDDIMEERMWVEWCKNGPAKAVATEIERICVKAECCGKRIFHDTVDIPMWKRTDQREELTEYGEELRCGIVSKFPDESSQKIISRACLGIE